MKKLLVFLCVLLAQTASAQWTVQSVPNTRLQGNGIHVSDPDGYLSDSAERVINDALSGIRDNADVFLVTLYSIGNAEPKQFATTLFNYWGIGDAATNNGVLLLFVEDQHAMEFETGYGAEAILTDAHCQRIFENSMKPYFLDGDYEGGLLEGVAQVIDVMGAEVPDGLASFAQSRPKTKSKPNQDDLIGGYIVLGILVFLFEMPYFSKSWKWTREEALDMVKDYKKNRTIKEEGASCFYEAKNAIKQVKKPRWILFFIVWIVIKFGAFYLFFEVAMEFENGLFLALLSFVLLVVVRTLKYQASSKRLLKEVDAVDKTLPYTKELYNDVLHCGLSRRTRWAAPWVGLHVLEAMDKKTKEPILCSHCGREMHVDDAVQLTEMQKKEAEIKSLEFESLHCDEGHLLLVGRLGSQAKYYAHCKKCGCRAEQWTKKILEAADYDNEGLEERTYTCLYCGNTYVKQVVIPRKEHSSDSDGSSGGGGSSSDSGSFGGGSSGGGGYSGRW